MSDFFEAVRALDADVQLRRDLIAIVGEIIFHERTPESDQRLLDLAWPVRSRLGFSRTDWQIEMAARRVEADIAALPRPEPVVDTRLFAMGA